MLTYDDCLGMSGLTAQEVATIARHKHLPEMVALEIGWGLCRTPEGVRQIEGMILDDIDAARRRGDAPAAAELERVLLRFVGTHPAGLGTAEPGLRRRAAASLAAMLRRLGLRHAAEPERSQPPMRVAELRCAACIEIEACRRFLAGAADAGAPSAFCPNAPLFEALSRLSPQS